MVTDQCGQKRAATYTGPSKTMSDIFREVDEEVRRDKALLFW